MPEGTDTVNIPFEGLSTDALIALGALLEAEAVEAVAEDAAAAAEAAESAAKAVAQPESLIKGGNLLGLLAILVVGEVALLGVMVLRHSGENTESFREQVEALVLLGVVVAVIVLGVTEQIGDEGLVSVLTAIVGYTLGRAGATKGQIRAGSGGAGKAAVAKVKHDDDC